MLRTLVTAPTLNEQHRPPDDHPDTAARIDAALRGIRPVGVDLYTCTGEGIDQLELSRVHSRAYLGTLLTGSGGFLPDGETWNGPGSYLAACAAAECAQTLAGFLARGDASNGIALTRPPGHHAHAGRGGGYCLLNNAVFASRRFRAERGSGRIAILDIDAHHGDGTESLVQNEPETLFVSIHERALFPSGTGTMHDLTWGAEDQANIVNLPLEAGADDADFLAAISFATRVVRVFEPDLIIVSYGTDGHADDPMSNLAYSTDGYRSVMRMILNLGESLCSGRIAVIMEGGYDYASLDSCFRACAEEMSVATRGSFKQSIKAPLASTAAMLAGVGAKIAQRGGPQCFR